jgi:dTDP-4-dehydrorhamnose reductase
VKILTIGSNGQLGHELSYTKPAGVNLYSVDIDALDITNSEQVQATINSLQPDLVINAAAYTAVDKAETDIETAFAVNEKGPENIARSCHSVGSRFIHVSTDFIFSGNSPLPYAPEDTAEPLSIYGKSKLCGEHAALKETNGEALIFRTAWVYSAHGNNFVKTMLRLMQEKEQISVIYDQTGSPTWARTLANTIWAAALDFRNSKGIYHWTDAGIASWYDFAVAIQAEALSLGLLDKEIPISPIRTSQYPTPAKRPSNSVLDCSKTWTDFTIQPAHWRVSLNQMLKGTLS